ncbi:uncharacterized protein LOC105444822 [Strongylocentrotus purpuratus]|uniref:Uncharacterized protein n=1 Tax=Strongylocentrotus purpuratus TaxID=7668 RepID=A0A7M7PIT0_STRPU|nr:uncharacterized protein LOC105444822 [Strongylocentrotus purpuratus]
MAYHLQIKRGIRKHIACAGYRKRHKKHSPNTGVFKLNLKNLKKAFSLKAIPKAPERGDTETAEVRTRESDSSSASSTGVSTSEINAVGQGLFVSLAGRSGSQSFRMPGASEFVRGDTEVQAPRTRGTGGSGKHLLSQLTCLLIVQSTLL